MQIRLVFHVFFKFHFSSVSIITCILYNQSVTNCKLRKKNSWTFITKSEITVLGYSIWRQGAHIFLTLTSLTIIQSCERTNKIYLRHLSTEPGKW